MKKLRTMLTLVVSLSMMIASVVIVNADTTTDLKSMTVYAVNEAGEKSVVNMDFSSTTYTYELTVMSDTVSIEIEAEVADGTSTWQVEKDGINTKMDFGRNFTEVSVTSATGVVNKYTLNTTRLTEAEQATYEGPKNEPVSKDDTTKSDSDVTVKVGKSEMKIASSFEKSAIPEGFKKADVEYNGKTYKGIKGEVKELSALYLYSDETEGFYIYDAASDSFYVMNNIQIKSRMYTIVNPETTDKVLENYDKKKVTIIDKEVNAWALDEEEGMYLVYAMNWNGETSLYCYDDNEKCFQRYLTSADSNSQMEAANKAYDNLQEKYNNLVDKYNVLLKVVCGLAVVIIILIFVVINLAISKKTKKIKSEARKEKHAEDKSENIDEDIREESEESVENAQEVAEENDIDFDDIDTIQESEEDFENIADEEPVVIAQETIDKKTEEVQQEAEEDLKETLKSMLPDENDDDEDDDEDFEFIDLD